MKNSFFAIALGLFILSCNYDKSSNGNIDQAYAKEDYASVHGQQKREIREHQKAASQIEKKESVVEVKDTAVTAPPAAGEAVHGEESHH